MFDRRVGLIVTGGRVAQLNHDTAECRQGWQRRELLIARCQNCETWIHPPRGICPQCWSDTVHAEAVDGAGHLVTWSLPRTGTDAAQPVITGVVAMDAAPGVRLLARIVDCPAGQVEVGMPLTVDWRGEDGGVVPQFRPAGVR
jgi:hypothetical protein